MTFPVFSAGTSAYNLTRSLRTRSSASAYLNRTPASASNQQKWTWSGWVKRGALSSTRQGIFSVGGASGTTLFRFGFDSSENILINDTQSSATVLNLPTTQVFRDPSAWYHIILAVDTTQATDTNRVKLYVNGVQVTSFSSPTYPAQNANTYVNNTQAHELGRMYNPGTSAFVYLDGYLAEVNFIDGQQLTPSSFGSTNAITGVWQPAKYTGTYGTNGFYLPFTDNSALTTASNAGLGKDFSGNANYWVTNNISITAGSTYDSMTDVPTLTSATAANYPTLNPIGSVGNGTYSSANLDFTSNSGSASWQTGLSTIGVSSGKWYCEITATAITGANLVFVGAAGNTFTGYASYLGASADGWGVQYGNGGTPSIFKYNNGSGTNITTGTIVAGDILQVAIDVDNGRIWFGKNNTWAEGSPSAGTGASFTNLTGTIFFGVSSNTTGNKLSANFGQRPLTYTAPTDFSTLNTYNLPASTVPNGAAYMAATTYTGTGASLTVANTVGSASFQPDLVWIKSRSATTDNKLTDVVRGVTKGLISNTTGAETTDTTGLTAFGSTGFTVGANTTYNNSGATYVAWQWKAGGTAVTNTSGSITSNVSVNTTSGCSVVTYTGNATANATVGHGLGVTPSMIIVKIRSTTGEWCVYHTSTGKDKYLFLQATDAAATSTNFWGTTGPTSSTIQLNGGGSVNNSGSTHVAYCFAAIKGFSAFGSYTGNGSTDSPFVYLGFRPRFILIKSSSAVTNWNLWDSSRLGYNVTNAFLNPDLSSAETVFVSDVDFLSNGFKLRTSWTSLNQSGATYIYMAFAENPFQNSLAR